MDPRWEKLGKVLVEYSVSVGRGEKVLISMGEVDSFPLCRAVHEAAVRAGALVQVIFLSESLNHSVLAFGDDAQAGWVPEVEASAVEWADVYIGLRGASDLHLHDSISDSRMTAHRKAMGVISSLRWKKKRWVLCRIPNEHFARQAGTDVDTIMDMFFSACFVDMAALATTMRKAADRMEGGRMVRITGPGTELEFSIEGRRWVVADGKINMPDGEIFTAPVHETMNGHISFEHPGVFGGRLMEGIRLEWKSGRLVSASARTNEAFLHQILSTDEGASSVGEFAFGFNEAIDRFSNDILFDEKIGGTLHIALGRSYPECGGTNLSALHLDIIKDMREHGAVFLDGKKIYERGCFLPEAGA